MRRNTLSYSPGPKLQLLNSLHEMWKRNDVIRDAHGNLSVRDGNKVHIKPSGVPYHLIGLSDVVTVDMDGIVLSGDLKPSVDTPHHLNLYKRFDDILSICHTHSPYATAYAIAGERLQCYSTEQADYFGDDVYVTSHRDKDSWSENVNYCKATLLQGHGTLILGKSPSECVKLAIALENIAMKNYLAEQIKLRRCSPSSMKPERLKAGEIHDWHERYWVSYGQEDDSTDSE